MVRLTDERDMIFLYHMRMTEEDYRWYEISLVLAAVTTYSQELVMWFLPLVDNHILLCSG